jgi:F0F1-type ATP synthase assembly protein I
MNTSFKLLGIGWFLAICIVGSGALGYFLDNTFNMLPLFTLIFIVLGILIGIFGTMKIILIILSSEK